MCSDPNEEFLTSDQVFRMSRVGGAGRPTQSISNFGSSDRDSYYSDFTASTVNSIALEEQLLSYNSKLSAHSFGNRTSNIGIGRQSNIPSRTTGMSLSNRSSFIGPNGRTTYSRPSVNQNAQYESRNTHPARNLSRMSTASRMSRMSRMSTLSRQQLPNPARESTSRLSRSSVTSSRRKDITLIAREFPPVTKDDFKFENLIGRGSFGIVLRCILIETGEVFAAKVLCKKDIIASDMSKYVTNEKAILSHLDSPFIVNLHYAFKGHRNLYLIQDLIEGGHLLNLIHQKKKLELPNVKFYSANIALALEYLHLKRIIFRDLKSSNLMIHTDGYLKLIDFGYAKVSAGKTTTLCGSPLYMAPEIFEGKPYGRSVDWWSMGVIVFEMIHGIAPFDVADRGNTKAVYESIKSNKIRFGKDIDETSRSFIQSLLTISPKKRMGKQSNGEWDVNNDSFFSELDFDLMIRQEMIPPQIQFNPPRYLESDTLRTKTNLPHGGDTEDENDFQISDDDSLHSFSSFNVQSKPVLVI